MISWLKDSHLTIAPINLIRKCFLSSNSFSFLLYRTMMWMRARNKQLIGWLNTHINYVKMTRYYVSYLWFDLIHNKCVRFFKALLPILLLYVYKRKPQLSYKNTRTILPINHFNTYCNSKHFRPYILNNSFCY